jgi:hypothetical protein
MAQCYYHADEPGIGVCMRCRVVICATCCTKLDGINHCHLCLKELARRPVRRRRSSSTGVALVVLGLACSVLWTLLWLVQGSLALNP